MTARLRTALLAATFFGVLTGAAAADPAMVVTDSNLRTGPGTQYPIVVTVPGGVSVDVQGCDGNWCVARYAGYEGYISQSLIAAAGAPGPAIAVVPNDDYYDEPYGYGYGYGAAYIPSYGYHRGQRRVVRPNPGNWQGNRGNWQSNRGNWQGRQGGVRSGGIARGGGSTGVNVRGGGGARGGFSGGSSGRGAGGGAGGGSAAPAGGLTGR